MQGPGIALLKKHRKDFYWFEKIDDMELKATNATLYFEKQKSARLDKAACKLRRKKRNAEFPSHFEIEFAKRFKNSELKPFDEIFDEIMHEPVRRIRRQIKWWEVNPFIILKKNFYI